MSKTHITLPFEPGRLESVSPDFIFSVFSIEGAVDELAETNFWVPPYSLKLDYAEIFAHMPELRVVQTQSAGVDNLVDKMPPGVTLCNARGVHDAATSELGVGLIIASLRQIPRFVQAQSQGHWDQDNMAMSLADRCILIVGYGSIGQALETRLAGFECDIVRVARTARAGVHGIDELPRLLPDADVVVLLAPLTDQTRHLADASFLGRMKDNALLVNLGRGPLVDTDALIAEASSGRIGAALDVTEPEPLPPDHPLWSIPGVLITPHVGGGTTAMKSRMMSLIAQQLERLAAGRDPLNIIPTGR